MPMRSGRLVQDVQVGFDQKSSPLIKSQTKTVALRVRSKNFVVKLHEIWNLGEEIS